MEKLKCYYYKVDDFSKFVAEGNVNARMQVDANARIYGCQNATETGKSIMRHHWTDQSVSPM